MTTRSAVTALALLVAVTGPCDGQSLAARVAATSDGLVRFAYAARPGVSGNGHNVIQWDCGRGNCRQQVNGDMSDVSDADWRDVCDSGPVRVELHVRRGTMVGVRVTVGGRSVGRPDVTDLGTVSAPEAARYFLSLARRSAGKTGGRAIFAATLADSTDVAPELLRIARDEDVATETRRQAVFWVSQAAEEAATRGLDSLVDEDTINREVREQAVFALSQRPREEGVPALLRIARTHHDAVLRRRAIFWLGQSNDPRALALFEELLTRP
ncbi:MAG: HEAT repeat domain-containing protein [Gemmatimonadales bacterium]